MKVRTLRISKYIHACLLIEKKGDKILFDPGKFSFLEGMVKADDFRDLLAIVLTHRHPDHFDDQALSQIIKNNPQAQTLTNTEIKTELNNKGMDAIVFESGRQPVGGFTLEAVTAEHAPLLNAKIPQNVGYVVDNRLLHPGDSFDHSLDVYRGIEVLALPVMAPWTTELQVAEFARRISPGQVIPIHDGYAKDFFLKQRYENFQKYFVEFGIKFQPLMTPGDYLEI
jgi:L-ascorbate metabolism protein UlaG (beta-lactamase superfamily)